MPPRRMRGDGSVYQRPSDHLWVGMLDLGKDPLGRRRRKAVYGKTQQEARDKLDEARREYADSGKLAPVTLTVRGWTKTWLDRLERDKTVQPLTLDGYRQKLDALNAYLGDRRLGRLEPEHVAAAYSALADRDRANSYIVQTHRILKHCLHDAYLDRKLSRDIAPFLRTPKVGKDAEETRAMTPEEFARIVIAFHGDRLASRWLFQSFLGPRQGEVLGLAWEDVDLEHGTVTIRRALQRQRKVGLQFVKPKSKESGRTLPMGPVLWEAMRIRHAEWQTEPHPALKGMGKLTPKALVWGQANGMPRDAKQDWKAWAQLLKRAGVEHMGTHSLRHGFATRLSELGEPIRVAQALLGHADPLLTMRVYTHTDDSALRRAVTLAEAAYGQEAKEIES